jgi:arylsulfatase
MTKLTLRTLLAGFVLAVTSGIGLAAAGDPVIGKTLAESKPGTAPVLPVAKGAPNLLWVLIDDSGFGASSTFGGGARTPVLDDLARNGLRYTNFHTTGVCSPSRG